MSSFWMDETFILGNWYVGETTKRNALKFPQKMGLKNPRSGNNSQLEIPSNSHSQFFFISGKMDLEKLVWALSISAQLPETFVLLWAKLFEISVFRPQSQGGKIPDFQSPLAPPDKLSNPDPGPSQRTQGLNTSARETLAVDVSQSSTI